MQKLIADYTKCKGTEKGTEYKGTISTTANGKTCQKWTEQSPHKHFMTDPSKFPDASLEEANNYCRNPDLGAKPWCYTTDPDDKWEYCDIPKCTGN